MKFSEMKNNILINLFIYVFFISLQIMKWKIILNKNKIFQFIFIVYICLCINNYRMIKTLNQENILKNFIKFFQIKMIKIKN